MKQYFKQIIACVILVGAMAACNEEEDDIIPVEDEDKPYDASKDEIIKPKNELRAAWISTVYNLDWPTTKGNAEAQKSELISILNRLQALNFNAVVLQVRPMADAFYPSQLEPWSSYLTGTQGVDPGYDPLAFAIEEAHKRGLELHAWLNPYRIGPTSLQLASSHVAVKHPDWVVTFKDVRYFNPGVPEARQHLNAVVRDLVSRYTIDAIHFDDYFYPSGAKSTSNPFGFDDQQAFGQYGGSKDIHAWRADNVNTMVREVYGTIQSVNPKVMFGISPSGRRENSLELYADPFVWMENKWIDYLAPQIYWEFGHATADFGKQAAFWNDNSKQIPIVVGIAAYKYNDPSMPAFASLDEFGRQISYIRQTANLHGCLFFRAKNLENTQLNSYLAGQFSSKSILPVMGKTSLPIPAAPIVSVQGTTLKWSPVSGADKYVVFVLERNATKKNSFNARVLDIISGTSFSATAGKSYFVTAVNSEHAESPKSAVVTL